MSELKLLVPTYYGCQTAGSSPAVQHDEFDAPHVPVVVKSSDGVRIVLGSHDFWDPTAPDVQIERRAGGWVIFLHPCGGGDPSGYVYFLDDGRSFVVPEHPACTTPPTRLLDWDAAEAEVQPPPGATRLNG